MAAVGLASTCRNAFRTRVWQPSIRRHVHLSRYIVTPKELYGALKKNPATSIGHSTSPHTIPLCATWFMPNDPQNRTGYQSFVEQRIPGARFLDIDAVKDNDSPYPHMLPSPDEFGRVMGELGVRRQDSVVVYDSVELGIFSAPRVGWMLRVFGHENVHILNNFKLWVEEAYPTESGEPTKPGPVQYQVSEMDREKVVAFEELREIAKDAGKEGAEGVQILDARSRGRWEGSDPEPRPGLSSGHMPGSISLPFTELLDPHSKTLLSAEKLKKVFTEKGLDPNRPMISTCGTGVTAAVIDAALSEAEFGHDRSRRLYDGSWT